MAKSKTVTMTAGKIKSSYNLKGKTTLNIVDNFTTGVSADVYLTQFVKSIDASGDNIILNCEVTNGAYKITLKNCTHLTSIYVSVNNTSYTYSGDSLNTFLYTYKNVITTYNAKKLTVTGSFLNDTIDFSDENLYVPTASNLKKNKGLTINAGAGTDTITGTKYNDTITGGAGINTVKLDTENIFGNDIYKISKNEQLKIETIGSGSAVYDKDKKGNVIITAKNTSGEITGTLIIKGLAKKDKTQGVTINDKAITFDFDEDNISKNKITGTTQNDEIDIKDTYLETGKGNNKREKLSTETGITINSGTGDDTIIGTKYSDTIIGGLGANTVKILNEQFGNDIIQLTKGEKLTIDLTEYELTDINQLSKVQVSGKNLVLTTDKGSVILKNFVKSNVAGDNGSVEVLLQKAVEADAENNIEEKKEIRVNLNYDNILTYTKDSSNFKESKGKMTFTGTRFGETIDTTGIDKPLTIKAGAGKNTIVIDNSNSFDITIAEEKLNAENVINFKNDIDSSYTITKNRNDLIISKDTSKLTINNYYSESTPKVTYSTKRFQVNGIDIANNAEFLAKGTYVIGGSGTIDGDDNQNTIIANDYDENIKASNDTITAGKGDDTINAGRGNNTIKFNVGDGADIVQDGGGIDTLVFSKGVNVNVEYSGDDLVVYYGNEGDTVTLKDYTPDHSVKYIKVGNSKANSIANYMYVPPKPDDSVQPDGTGLIINGTRLIQGTDNADEIVVKTNGVNKIYAGGGDDVIKPGGDEWTTNYVFAGKGDDTIYSGAGIDILSGGGGKNTIHFSKGSGTDKFYVDNEDDTLVFDNITFSTDADGNVTGLGNLKLEKVTGAWMATYTECDLKISGYGTKTNNNEDCVLIRGYFNLEGYDYSKFKLRDKNGNTISILDAVPMKISDTMIYMSKNRTYTATDSDETIYVKTENKGTDDLYTFGHITYTNSSDGNDTIYSGGVYARYENGKVYRSFIRTGNGDNIVHAEGNKIYFTTELTDLNYSKSAYVQQINTSVPDTDGIAIPTTTTIYDADHIYVTPKNDVMTGYFFLVYKTDEAGHIIEFENIPDTNKYSLYATDKVQDDYGNEIDGYIYHAENLEDIIIQGKKTYFFDYGDLITSGWLQNPATSEPGIITGDGNDTIYTGYGAIVTPGAGDDTIYGDGTIGAGSGNDKVYLSDDNLYIGGMGQTQYYVDGQDGNDYVDLTDVKGTSRYHTLNLSSGTIVYGADYVNYDHSEGVDTLVINPEIDIPVHISLWPTRNDGSGQWNNRNSYGNHSNVYNNYTAFQKGNDLVLANGNGISPSSGTLIIKDYYKKDENDNYIFTDTAKENIYLWFDPSFRDENDYYLGQTHMSLDEFVAHVGLTDYYNWDVGNKKDASDIRHTRENNLWFELINNADADNPETVINTPILYQEEEKVITDYEHFTSYVQKQNVARGKYILGGNGSQTIYGGDGHDVIYGDDIYGHDEYGNYIESTDTCGDTIYAGRGNDYIQGGSGADFIDGGSGSDYINGGGGDDTLVGGSLGTEEEFEEAVRANLFNFKEIHGGDGVDTIYSIGAYTDGVFDSEKSKSYQGGDKYFTNNIYGDDGDDIIHVNGYRDIVHGGNGDDTIYSYAESVDLFYNSNVSAEIFGDDGDDHIILKSKADIRVYGGDGDDTIDARESDVIYYNTLEGGNGNDTIYGGSGKDIISTGSGDNYVDAGDGDDEISGGDSWLGQGEDNTIYAGAGNDIIRTSGTSKVYGEAGNDTIYLATGYRNAPSNLYIDGGDGDDTYIADGEYGFDTIVASSGNDVIEFHDFNKDSTSYTYNENDLVLSYTNNGYPAGLILKDYKLGGFADFTIKTFGGYDESYAQNGQYKMADFVKYLDNQYSMKTNGTPGDDSISSTGTINGLGGNDFIIACSSSSTAETPQIVDTGSGRNSVLAVADYVSITGGDENDTYSLSGLVQTLVDAGGSNTVNVVRNSSGDNKYYDITLNGDGDNTVSGISAAYKITATGSGKQIINIPESWDSANHPVTNENLYTEITTGSGDDEITINLGKVRSGAGADKITVTDGAGAGTNSYPIKFASLNGGEGDDSYIIQGGHNWVESGISVNTKVLISDSSDSNEVIFTSPLITHDRLVLLLNVTSDGNLAEFTHTVYNSDTGENDIEGTGYSAFICGDMDMRYAGTVSTASNKGWDICDGVKFADKSTMEHLSKIEASDGYSITNETLWGTGGIIEQVAGWLTSDGRGYGSVMEAIKPEGQNDFNTNNYNALYAIFNNENLWSKDA